MLLYYVLYIYIYTHVDRYGNLQQPEMASLTVVPTYFVVYHRKPTVPNLHSMIKLGLTLIP